MTKGVYGPIWYKNPEAYHSRTQQGFAKSRHVVGQRAAQYQSTGRTRENKLVSRRRQNTATCATSRIAPNTTSRHWKKADVDRLDSISTSHPIRFTREAVRDGRQDMNACTDTDTDTDVGAHNGQKQKNTGEENEREKENGKGKEKEREKEKENNGDQPISTPIESNCQIS
jgi:hypothetical protein